MDSPELFIAFGAVMLVVALLSVAVDWFGKPLKHRRFVPKAYRYPDERQPRRSQVRSTEWSEAPFVMPVVEAPVERQPLRYPDPRTAGSLDTPLDPLPPGVGVDLGPPTTMVPVVELGVDADTPLVFEPDTDEDAGSVEGLGDGDELVASTEAHPRIVTLEETDPEAVELATLVDDAGLDGHETETDPADAEPTSERSGAGRLRGWRPGQYVFNLTPDGREPSATTVRTRYWKNVADTGGAGIFGSDNVARMSEGKAPRRFNHRTGKHESMSLPTAGYDVQAGQTPVPAWPVAEVDPFA